MSNNISRSSNMDSRPVISRVVDRECYDRHRWLSAVACWLRALNLGLRHPGMAKAPERIYCGPALEMVQGLLIIIGPLLA